MEFYYDIQILIAAFVVMILGAIWYSPVLFQKRWTKLSGVDLNDPLIDAKMRKRAPILYLGTFVSTVVMATILSTVMEIIGSEGIHQGKLIGITMWVGFIITTSFINYSFSMRPFGLWFLDSGYHLISLMAMGAILGV